MIIRCLKQKEYEAFQKQQFHAVQHNPLDAGIVLCMKVNQREYRMKIQPEPHYKVVILQAVEVQHKEYGDSYLLITDNKILSSLLELLLWQNT